MIGIIFFVLACFGLGFIIDLFVDFRADILKWAVIHFGVGLGTMPILGVLLKSIHVPIRWIDFLLVALVVFSVSLIFRKKQLIPALKIKWQPLVILMLVGISMFMYIGGSYKYPWFEDSDPWEYAEASRYIGETGTYDAPFYFNHFAEPYPQGYQIVMGVLYQLNGSIYNTMKMFHNLIISLAVLFFFYFVLRISDNYRIAFLSSVFLWAIPAFFSHFIFSLTFNMTIMMVFFYALLRKWKFVSALLFASLWVTHFYTAVIASVFFVIIYLSRVIATKKFNKEYIQIGFWGMLLSMVFWIPDYFKYVKFGLLNAVPAVGGAEMVFPYWKYASIMFCVAVIAYFTHPLWFKHMRNLLKHIYFLSLGMLLLVLIVPSPGSIKYVSGSGDRMYGIGDFFIAKGHGLFNNPVGIGLVIMVLFTVGMVLMIINFKMILKRSNLCSFTSFNLALFGLVGIFGKSLSIGFLPFRMWTFFAIPCAIVAGIALHELCSLVKNKWVVTGLVILVCVGVFLTSFHQKYELNTSMWMEHKAYSPNAIISYYNAPVPKESALIGMCHPIYVASSYDYNVKPWISKEFAFYYKFAMNESVEENHRIYEKYNVSYVIVDSGCARKFKYPMDVVNQKVTDMNKSGLFKIVQVKDESILFRVM